mmetsp:Transcript_45102/g.88914  ORF Transcript_45102/g.88914 Transcript_45102/m.88914 type:complete len:274 (-) Transcript_45102:2607-3428(-)
MNTLWSCYLLGALWGMLRIGTVRFPPGVRRGGSPLLQGLPLSTQTSSASSTLCRTWQSNHSKRSRQPADSPRGKQSRSTSPSPQDLPDTHSLRILLPHSPAERAYAVPHRKSQSRAPTHSILRPRSEWGILFPPRISPRRPAGPARCTVCPRAWMESRSPCNAHGSPLRTQSCSLTIRSRKRTHSRSGNLCPCKGRSESAHHRWDRPPLRSVPLPRSSFVSFEIPFRTSLCTHRTLPTQRLDRGRDMAPGCTFGCPPSLLKVGRRPPRVGLSE